MAENNTDSEHDINVEKQYLRATDTHIPFSTNLRADLYLKLKRIEHHDPDASIREVLENAVEAYVNGNPLADKPLSEKARKKLKPIKTTYEYRKEQRLNKSRG